MTMGEKQVGFLPEMTDAFIQLESKDQISTEEFVRACEKVSPFFDHIGTVFMIAKHEFNHKRETLEKIADTCPYLGDVVQLSQKKGNITVKNSPGRNLHRLMKTLAFIRAIFDGLLQNMSLKDSVSTAYDSTLGLLHNWVVRTGIKTGLLGLPSKEHFLHSIGETEESARTHARAFVAAADKLVADIESLFAGIDMPKSDFTMAHLWGK